MKVLLAVGGRDESLAALDRAVERAAVAGDDLSVAVFTTADSNWPADEIERLVHERLDAAGLTAPVDRMDEDPGPRIVERAETGGFEAVVIGGGNTSPLGKIQLGPITEFVVLNAPMTVILVR